MILYFKRQAATRNNRERQGWWAKKAELVATGIIHPNCSQGQVGRTGIAQCHGARHQPYILARDVDLGLAELDGARISRDLRHWRFNPGTVQRHGTAGPFIRIALNAHNAPRHPSAYGLKTHAQFQLAVGWQYRWERGDLLDEEPSIRRGLDGDGTNRERRRTRVAHDHRLRPKRVELHLSKSK